MNGAEMKEGQRFMMLWCTEYVWLSAVWWKQLDLSDGHMERNLLNDFIPPEKSEEEVVFFVFCFYLCLSHSGPNTCRCVLENESKGCITKQKLKYAYYATQTYYYMFGVCVWWLRDSQRETDFSSQLWWSIAFRFRFVSQHLNQFEEANNFGLAGVKRKWLPASADSAGSHCLHT